MGGASELLQPWVGDPCLVYQTVSKQWAHDGALNSPPAFKIGTIDNKKAPVMFLETRVGDCFHYALMDLSDPVLWKTLDKWKRKRGFVFIRQLAGGASVGACPLNDDIISRFEKYRRNSNRSRPGAFARMAQSFRERGLFEANVAKLLRAEGREDSTDSVVEVQILSSAAIRAGAPLNNRYDTAGEAPQNGADRASRDDKRTLGLPLVPIGTLHNASEFARISTSASTLKPDTPVLGSSIDMKRLLDLSRVEGTFGFGHFRVDGRIVLSIRYQSGAAQVYWLADSADPSVWAAIDIMKKNGEVGFMFEEGSRGAFVPWKLLPHHEDIRILRAESLSHPDGLSDAAVALATSGLVEANATTDIPGTELRYVHVNVLANGSVTSLLQTLQAPLPDSVNRHGDRFDDAIVGAANVIH